MTGEDTITPPSNNVRHPLSQLPTAARHDRMAPLGARVQMVVAACHHRGHPDITRMTHVGQLINRYIPFSATLALFRAPRLNAISNGDV